MVDLNYLNLPFGIVMLSCYIYNLQEMMLFHCTLQRPPSLFKRLMGVMRNSSQSLNSDHSDAEYSNDGRYAFL